MQIDLSLAHQQLIINLLTEALGPAVTISAFGSRVNGNARPFSDLDLLLKSDKPISYQQLAEAEELLSESDLPFTIDLLDSARISDHFRQHIKVDLVVLGVTGKQGAD